MLLLAVLGSSVVNFKIIFKSVSIKGTWDSLKTCILKGKTQGEGISGIFHPLFSSDWSYFIPYRCIEMIILSFVLLWIFFKNLSFTVLIFFWWNLVLVSYCLTLESVQVDCRYPTNFDVRSVHLIRNRVVIRHFNTYLWSFVLNHKNTEFMVNVCINVYFYWIHKIPKRNENIVF